MDLTRLSNWQIAELLLVKLTWSYSEGGIDAGRSVNSDLLDLVFALKTDSKYHVNISEDESILIAEIDRRISRGCVEDNSQLDFDCLGPSAEKIAKYLLLALKHYQTFLMSWEPPLYLTVPVNKVCQLLCKGLESKFCWKEIMQIAEDIKWENFRYHRNNLCNYFAYPTEFSPDQ